MDKCGGRVTAEIEGHQEQHFGSLGEVSVHAAVIPREAVMVPHAHHIPQVVAGAVRTHFRRQSIKEVVANGTAGRLSRPGARFACRRARTMAISPPHWNTPLRAMCMVQRMAVRKLRQPAPTTNWNNAASQR